VLIEVEVAKWQIPKGDRQRDYDGRDPLRSISGMDNDVREDADVDGDDGQDGQANHFLVILLKEDATPGAAMSQGRTRFVAAISFYQTVRRWRTECVEIFD
jgi:hypothetical protein